MWSRYTVFQPVGSNGSSTLSFPLAGVRRRFFLLPLLIWTSMPSGSFTWKLRKSSPLWSATGSRPRAFSAASTFFVSHGSMPQQNPSHTTPAFWISGVLGVVHSAMWLGSSRGPRPRPLLSPPPSRPAPPPRPPPTLSPAAPPRRPPPPNPPRPPPRFT